MDVIGIQTSFVLRYGVPLETIVNKLAYIRFDPSGFTGNPDIPFAKSVVERVFRWIGMEFIPGYRADHAPQAIPGPEPAAEAPAAAETGLWALASEDVPETVLDVPLKPIGTNAVRGYELVNMTEAVGAPRQAKIQSDAPACDNGGSITFHFDTCYRCGNSMGCS
jgi:ribonucleoside-diphosphate reductase alpha chain